MLASIWEITSSVQGVLTTLLLMQALDASEYADNIKGKFKQRCSIDPYRMGYYSDLCEYIIIMLKP